MIGFSSAPRFVEHRTSPSHPERPDRIRATIKFVIYTLAGSLLMLVAIVAVYLASGDEGHRTLYLPDLIASRGRFSSLNSAPTAMRQAIRIGQRSNRQAR